MIDLAGRRAPSDRAFAWSAGAAAGLVLLVLGLIAITITRRALPVLGQMGLHFFTTRRWSPPDDLFGALPFIWGTAFTAVIALAIAVPVSLGLALFMSQVAPPRLAKPLVYLIDLLAGIPSVVFGLWGVLVLSQVFDLGRSFLTAGVILAIMIIPIITSLSREVIDTTPVGDKEGRWRWGPRAGR